MSYKSIMFFFLLAILSLAESSKRVDPGVYISVSSVDYMKIELNWHDLEINNNYEIQLHNSDPTSIKSNPLTTIKVKSNRGFYKTNFTIGKLPQTIQEANGCQNFWITLSKANKIIAKNCFKFNPKWMEDISDCLRNKPMLGTVIPGAHDAGSRDPKFSTDLISRFVRAQQLSTWEQFLFGIRYLDLRPGVSALDNEIHIIHGDFFTQYLVKDIIKIAKKAIEATTKEIIIMEFGLFNQGFHGKPGLENHKKLIKLIHDILEQYMIPREYGHNVTFDRLWKENKRIVVTYRAPMYKDYPLLWDYIRTTHEGTTDVDTLKKNVIKNLNKRDQSKMIVMTGELTPKVEDIIEGLFNVHSGLRYYANDTNRKVTSWVRHEIRNKVNIAITDYVMGADIVNLAIKINCERK